MKTFYADDTYARYSKDEMVHNIHFLGGMLIKKSDEPKLIKIIQDIKSEYTHPNLPMKWNFKDNVIIDKFKEFGRESEYKKMLIASNDWRRKMITESLKLDYKIIFGLIKSYSDDKKKIQKSKYDMLKYTFENILMRLNMEANGSNYETFIILDWPPDSNPQPFINGFYKLYYTGLSSSGTPIYGGELQKNKFYHSLLFAKCNHSPLLQFSDLLVGSFKDYIEAKFFEKENHFANELFELYKPKIRNNSGKMVSYGILPSTGNYDLTTKLKTILNE